MSTFFHPDCSEARARVISQEMSSNGRVFLEDVQQVRISPELERLYNETTAIPGRPGWRVDGEGRVFYSDVWSNW